MTKTLDDYMNDPEIAHEPMALREIHAIRLQIYDETKDMTDAEYHSLVRREAMEFLQGAEARKKLKAALVE
jgi:predicted DNA-binding protein (UPF0251 family)